MYVNLKEADALHVQIVQRTKGNAKVDFTRRTTQMEN